MARRGNCVSIPAEVMWCGDKPEVEQRANKCKFDDNNLSKFDVKYIYFLILK